MASDITMPKLSDTMTEGVLVEWRKNVGQWVERGEIIAEVETDKANMELEAFVSGVLLEVRAKPGDTVAVGTVIAVVGEEGEQPAEKPPERPAPEPEKKPSPPPAAEAKEQQSVKEVAAPPSAAKEAPEGATAEETKKEAEVRAEAGLEELGEGVTAAAGPEAAKEAPPPGEVRKEEGARPGGAEPPGGEKASPLVRRLARERGIDLGSVTGSGPEGRILQEDLERFQRKPSGEAAPAAKEAARKAEPAEPRPAAAQPLSRMRGAIARTVAESWRTIPHFTVTIAIDMGEGERVRQELKEAGVTFSLNDLVVKAAAVAIGKFPLINASFAENGVTSHEQINIGIMVALDDGLLVPVVRDCQRLSLKEIAARSREVVERARSGKISEADLSGGTFSVSNLGKFGVEEFMAVIHPSQGAILAVGAVTDQPVIREGHFAVARIMRATLSGDHRLIDGAYAAQFLQELKRALENPVQMLV